MSHSPYQDLFIYYLEGRVQPSAALQACDGFIGNWEEEGDSFLFFSRPAEETVNLLIEQQSHLTLADSYRMAYEDWQGGDARPITVGRLHIVAPWHTDIPADGSDVVLLDPGVVFGTGVHPTTHDCLTALQLAMDRSPVTQVLDLGTGTGLLALAAARLGAERVLAIDLNHLAVQTARRNVGLNNMRDRVLVAQGNAKNFMDLAGDLMVSNIHYDAMRVLVDAPEFRAHKQYVLSGLLRSQAKHIETSLLRRSTILQKWERDGIWYTFWGKTQ
jgi:ribosomal protein L11 methyltransferase